MKKINTPVQELIAEFKRLQSKAQKLTDVIYLDGVIAVLESRLPDEQKTIINIYNQGKECVANELPSLSGIRKDSEIWFTQTFKSYE